MYLSTAALPASSRTVEGTHRFSRNAASSIVGVEGQGGPKAAPIARDPALSLRLKGLVLVLEDFAGTDDHCWPSQKTLEQATGLSKRNLCHALKDAEDSGLIRRVKDEGRRARVGILLLRRSRATLPAAVDLGSPNESALRSRRASKATPKPGDPDGRESKTTADCASIPTPGCASKATRRLTGSDYVQKTTLVTDDDHSARTLPEPGLNPSPALAVDAPAIDLILGLAPGSDHAMLDRIARQVVADLGDDPGRLDQHRRNLARIARGDRVELARVLAGLLAGCRARRKGGKGGPAFASAYLALASPDAARADQVVVQAAADLRSLAQAAAAARAAIAERSRHQEQQRTDRREGERRRAELRQSLAGLRLPADASPAAIVAALAESGLTLTAQRLPGLRPRLSLGDELGLGDLPPGFRDALERGREALARHLESPGTAT